MRKGRLWLYNISIYSPYSINVTIEPVEKYHVVDVLESGPYNMEPVTKSYSNLDIPEIVHQEKLKYETRITLQWIPISRNITGFSIVARDETKRERIYTPTINYCICENLNAECIANFSQQNAEINSNDSSDFSDTISFCINVVLLFRKFSNVSFNTTCKIITSELNKYFKSV